MDVNKVQRKSILLNQVTQNRSMDLYINCGVLNMLSP